MAPDYYRVHQLMGEAALAADRPTEAENEFREALDAKPKSLEVLAELGNLKRSQSKYDEAIDYYTKAEQAGPLNYDTAYGLGVCYTFTEEYDRVRSITCVSRFASTRCRPTRGWPSVAPGFRTESSRRRYPSSSARYSLTLTCIRRTSCWHVPTRSLAVNRRQQQPSRRRNRGRSNTPDAGFYQGVSISVGITAELLPAEDASKNPQINARLGRERFRSLSH